MDYATKKTLRKAMNKQTSSNKSNVFSNWKLKSKINLVMLCHTSFSQDNKNGGQNRTFHFWIIQYGTFMYHNQSRSKDGNGQTKGRKCLATYTYIRQFLIIVKCHHVFFFLKRQTVTCDSHEWGWAYMGQSIDILFVHIQEHCTYILQFCILFNSIFNQVLWFHVNYLIYFFSIHANYFY